MTICLSCGRLVGYGVTCQHCGAPAPAPARLEDRMIHILDILAKDRSCWCQNNMGEHSSICEEVRVFYSYLQARPQAAMARQNSGRILSPDLGL